MTSTTSYIATETTDGLVSGYQRTQVTGSGGTATLTTGGSMAIGVHVIPVRVPLGKLWEAPAPVQTPPAWAPAPDDPADAPFASPLGTPRTHQERAALLRSNFRPAPDDTDDVAVPEDLF